MQTPMPKSYKRTKNIHLEPFWGPKITDTSEENQSIQLINRGIVLIGHGSFSEPSQIPIKIRQYGMN
jgi:hypothetical protein